MNERALLDSARRGDEDAYARLVGPHRAELHAHCYRMLGSVHDAEDALQEALLRAWRGLARFEGRSSLRSWLYRIATNACLRAIERRPRLVLPIDYGPASDPHDGPGAPLTESTWIEPYPDERLGLDDRARRAGGALRAARERRARLHRRAPAPAGAAARRADPPRRARLLGRRGRRHARDEPGVGLQRAAARPQDRRRAAPGQSQQATLRSLGDERLGAIVGEYVGAWERGDVDAVAAMLAEDATITMPPLPTWYRGREAVAAFLGR